MVVCAWNRQRHQGFGWAPQQTRKHFPGKIAFFQGKTLKTSTHYLPAGPHLHVQNRYLPSGPIPHSGSLPISAPRLPWHGLLQVLWQDQNFCNDRRTSKNMAGYEYSVWAVEAEDFSGYRHSPCEGKNKSGENSKKPWFRWSIACSCKY